MIVLRPVRLEDLDVICEMTIEAGPGMASLPKSREKMLAKIELSVNSFAKDVTKVEDEFYFFLLEDIETGKKGGICGIKARTGVKTPVYFYMIEELPPLPSHLPTPKERRVLRPIKFDHHPSELCALFLKPEFRRDGLGRLLSLSRLLFIAEFRKRFKNIIMADLRGTINQNNESVLWNALGKKYLDMTFQEAFSFFEENREEYFNVALPKDNVYVGLLPKEAQEIIGEVHPNSKPALNMLIKEGFKKGKFIDVFEGGPTIEANIKEIRCVRDSYLSVISSISAEPIESETFIITNNKIDFKSCYGTLHLQDDEETVTISEPIARALQVGVGDIVRFAHPSPPAQMVYRKSISEIISS